MPFSINCIVNSSLFPPLIVRIDLTMHSSHALDSSPYHMTANSQEEHRLSCAFSEHMSAAESICFKLFAHAGLWLA